VTKSLAIVGAGPKAAAIVARAAVLRELWPEREHPQIVVYEQVAPGSAWSGEAGYTSGLLQLCSPAEKDIGFPYVETTGLDGDPTRSIAGEIFRRFSWNAFLVETGRFADWVDRGREPPPHAAWAHYIAWVFERAGQACTIAEVTRIARTGHGMWRITSRAGDVDNLLDSDGVVLTGTGDPRRVPERGEIPAQRIFDPADVWAARDLFLAGREKVVAVVGDGGAAGAVAAWLAPRLAERGSSLRSISPLGTLLPRGDGHAERRWFTDPSDWRELSEPQRQTLLAHTESGVISLRNKAVIDAASNVEYAVGRAEGVRFELDELLITIGYDRPSGDGGTVSMTRDVAADYLVNAMGFDPWSVLKIVRGKAQALLADTPTARALKRTTTSEMRADLSLPPSSEVPDGLHVPGLCGLARGPGMPTLGCLGLVASAVLDGYVD
jgi:mycobactin lysine-N-oxygenase